MPTPETLYLAPYLLMGLMGGGLAMLAARRLWAPHPHPDDDDCGAPEGVLVLDKSMHVRSRRVTIEMDEVSNHTMEIFVPVEHCTPNGIRNEAISAIEDSGARYVNTAEPEYVLLHFEFKHDDDTGSPHTPFCAHCRSTDVVVDVPSFWNDRQQCFEPAVGLDPPYFGACNTCGREDELALRPRRPT